MNIISDKRVLEIWKDSSFNGSYRGISAFKLLLKTDLGIEIEEKRLYKILKEEPLYLMHLRPQRQFDRRHYDLHFYGELVQADIAYMFSQDDFKYFLLFIDCYSSKIFTYPLKSKDSETVAKALKLFLEDFKAQVYVLQTDKGENWEKVIRLNFRRSKSLISDLMKLSLGVLTVEQDQSRCD
jgi:hypothetical protein